MSEPSRINLAAKNDDGTYAVMSCYSHWGAFEFPMETITRVNRAISAGHVRLFDKDYALGSLMTELMATKSGGSANGLGFGITPGQAKNLEEVLNFCQTDTLYGADLSIVVDEGEEAIYFHHLDKIYKVSEKGNQLNALLTALSRAAKR